MQSDHQLSEVGLAVPVGILRAVLHSVAVRVADQGIGPDLEFRGVGQSVVVVVGIDDVRFSVPVRVFTDSR